VSHPHLDPKKKGGFPAKQGDHPLPVSPSPSATFPSSSPHTMGAVTAPAHGPGSARKKRIRFSAAWDVLLLKAVTAVDAHIAPHGEAQARFEEALTIFLSSGPPGGFDAICTPTWKTLSDRFKKVLCDHRQAVRNNAVASGIIEVRGERETLLDDVVLEVDELDEKRRTERDERTELDNRLLAAGEDVRARALGRRIVEDAERKRRSVAVDSDSDEQDVIGEHIEARRELDVKRARLDEDRLSFENEVAEKEDLRALRQQENDAKRLLLDQRRIDLEIERVAMEREERRSAMEERKGMLAVLSALVKKLE